MLKQAAPSDLVSAIRCCARGDGWLDPAVVGHVLSDLRASGRSHGAIVHLPINLTPRELEVLTLMAHGHSNGEISALLHISEATARTHVAHLIAKTDSRNRTEVVVLAYRSGLMSRER